MHRRTVDAEEDAVGDARPGGRQGAAVEALLDTQAHRGLTRVVEDRHDYDYSAH